jgi:hypothetical protein
VTCYLHYPFFKCYVHEDWKCTIFKRNISFVAWIGLYFCVFVWADVRAYTVPTKLLKREISGKEQL